MAHLHIDSFQDFGDSWVVIQNMQNIQSRKDKAMDRMQKRIHTFLPQMSQIQFFHVKRKKNRSTNRLINMGARLNYGEIMVNNTPTPTIKGYHVNKDLLV